MFQTLMPSQVYITLKIWINNKVTESPTIIVCHDKDCGQSASLQPSPITSKERRCLVNRLLKAAAACKVNRWVTGDNQPHHHEGKAVWKLETVRYITLHPTDEQKFQIWWCQVLQKMRFNKITDALRGAVNWLLRTARWCSLAKLESSFTQQLHTRTRPEEYAHTNSRHVNKNVHSDDA